jgi:hypothetical protein
MGLREIGCEDGRWIELAQDRDQWWAFVLAVLNLCVLLPGSSMKKKSLNSKRQPQTYGGGVFSQMAVPYVRETRAVCGGRRIVTLGEGVRVGDLLFHPLKLILEALKSKDHVPSGSHNFFLMNCSFLSLSASRCFRLCTIRFT